MTNKITVIGNAVEDPELRFTPSGAAVCNLRIVSNKRVKNTTTGEWEDRDATFLTCNIWRQMAENVAESIERGMRVIVTGDLKQRDYETREGQKRSTYEIDVDAIGPDLRWAVAKPRKVGRQDAQTGPQGSDPWSAESSPSSSSGNPPPSSDEPPF